MKMQPRLVNCADMHIHKQITNPVNVMESSALYDGASAILLGGLKVGLSAPCL